MKNPDSTQLARLRARASRIAARLGDAKGSSGAFSPVLRERIHKEASRILRENRAVGASLILCPPGDGSETFHFGSARLAPRQPVGENTCMRVASVSKLVMTFGALALCERGLLSLDDDLSPLLGYPLRNPKFPDLPVTLRMLLTHTAGITDSGSYGTRGMQPGCTLRELLEAPENWRDVPPGDSFQYSNLGAGVAGVVMELAAKQPFDDIMRSLVFSPLGIRASYDPRRVLPHDDLADGYDVRFFIPRRKYDAAKLSVRPPEPFDPERDFLIAAGRLITDANGMGQLVRLLGETQDTPVLSASSLSQMRALQDGIGGIRSAGRGLNVAFLPDVFPGFSPVGHQGVAYGMCAELFADPKKNAGVGVMMNGVRLKNRDTLPLMQAGFDLLALGFAAMDRLG